MFVDVLLATNWCFCWNDCLQVSLWWTESHHRLGPQQSTEKARRWKKRTRQVNELRRGVLPTSRQYNYLLSTIATPRRQLFQSSSWQNIINLRQKRMHSDKFYINFYTIYTNKCTWTQWPVAYTVLGGTLNPTHSLTVFKGVITSSVRSVCGIGCWTTGGGGVERLGWYLGTSWPRPRPQPRPRPRPPERRVAAVPRRRRDLELYVAMSSAVDWMSCTHVHWTSHNKKFQAQKINVKKWINC